MIDDILKQMAQESFVDGVAKMFYAVAIATEGEEREDLVERFSAITLQVSDALGLQKKGEWTFDTFITGMDRLMKDLDREKAKL